MNSTLKSITVKTLTTIILIGLSIYSCYGQDTIVKATILDDGAQNAEKFYNSGVEKFNKGDFQGAIKEFDQSIGLKPEFDKAYHSRGNSFYELQDLNKALDDYNMALNISQQDLYYFSRAEVKNDLNDKDGAISDYSSSIALNTGNAQAYYNRGVIRFEKSDFEGSIQDFTEAIKYNQQFAYAYNDRGSAFRQLEQFDKAIADYNLDVQNNYVQSGANYYRQTGAIQSRLARFSGYSNAFSTILNTGSNIGILNTYGRVGKL